MISIQLEQLTISINQRMICNHINLHLPPGSILGLLGPNGSGKTTFLHTLAGLYPYSSGSILLGKQSLAQLSLRALAQMRGILFQDFQAFLPQTVWEYCLTARYPHLPYFKTKNREDEQIVMEAVQAMELTPHIHRMITQLSGGEKRRLAIAALLAQTPVIYLLDEPTNHLDMRHQIQVLTHFYQLAKMKSHTIMMSLHDINLAQRFCDYILLFFPHAETIYGPASMVLTVDHLTRLYQYPLHITTTRNKKFSFWYAGEDASFCEIN